MMNQSDLAKELDMLNDALEVIDNFTEHYNVNLEAFKPKHYDDNLMLSNSNIKNEYFIAFKGIILYEKIEFTIFRGTGNI